MKTILFVCTGNTCRSSMAEGLFKEMLKSRPDIQNEIKVISAGTGAWDGDRASQYAIAVLREKGIDLKEHRSTALTLDIIKNADLILTMTTNHKFAILNLCPEAQEKVFTLKEYTGCEEADASKLNFFGYGNPCDISDPFGQSIEVYRKSAEEIEQSLKKLIEKIK